MADTVRTTSELLTIFADGQPPGSITPQDVRDLVVTMEDVDDGKANAADLATEASTRAAADAALVAALESVEDASIAADAALDARVLALETDGAPPETHAATHAEGGADPVTITQAQVAGLVAALAGKLSATPPAFATLADAATITWATGGASVSNAKVTLAGNRTLDITGAVTGASGELRVTQDATGGRTLTLPVGAKVVNAPLALASAPGALTVLAWSYDGATFVFTFGGAT